MDPTDPYILYCRDVVVFRSRDKDGYAFLEKPQRVDVIVTGPITFLNWVFAFAFPLLPYELFTFFPWAVLFLASSGKVSVGALTGFTTLLPAVFFGIVHALGTVAAFDEVVATLADAPTNAFASRVWHAALSTARRWARPDVSRRVLKLMAERDEIPNALHHATHLGALARKGLHGDVEEYYNSLPHPIKQDADVATVMSRSRDDSGLVL